jgi:Na+-transporting NADH:ubiquinone oxidoreductase subunit C
MCIRDSVNPDLPAAAFQVDGLSGATVTGDAVNRMIAYWFGPHGYAPLLRRLETNPPVQPASKEEPAT